MHVVNIRYEATAGRDLRQLRRLYHTEPACPAFLHSLVIDFSYFTKVMEPIFQSPVFFAAFYLQLGSSVTAVRSCVVPARCLWKDELNCESFHTVLRTASAIY